jgi:hypothetical protein
MKEIKKGKVNLTGEQIVQKKLSEINALSKKLIYQKLVLNIDRRYWRGTVCGGLSGERATPE